MMVKRVLTSLLLALALALALPDGAGASGPFRHVTPFFDDRDFEDLLAGNLTDRFGSMTLTPLISYLHLTGQFTPRHAPLFRYQLEERRARGFVWRPMTTFAQLLRSEGIDSPYFDSWKTITRTVTRDGKPFTTKRGILNCAVDAFRVAGETLEDRKARYGAESPEFKRWIDAQIKVFDHCGDTAFDPPSDPQAEWGKLEKYDRHYQIAASFFYDGQYLEAARRFTEIGNSDSPWSDLSRYLVGRSYAREAIIDEERRNDHLQRALSEYRSLSNDYSYRASYPWIQKQVRNIEAQLNPIHVLDELEHRIVYSPETVSFQDIQDYIYLDSSHYRERRGGSEYADWRALAGALSRWTAYSDQATAEVIDRWRREKTLEWLFLALIGADSSVGEDTLEALLNASALGAEAPGYYVILEHRVRIAALMGDMQTVRSLAEPPYWGNRQPSPGHINRIRMRAANVSVNWDDYFRFASMRPLDLPWSDSVVSNLSEERFNHITSETTLFGSQTTELINKYFTPQMMLEAISHRSLSNYQRDRLAIAGWMKAMLLEDRETAGKFSQLIQRFLPRLEERFDRLESGKDPAFEAALIVLDNPAFSPHMWPDIGRYQEGHTPEGYSPVRPAPDYVALPLGGYNWWCPTRVRAELTDRALAGPRFAHYGESELEQVRQLEELQEISVAGFFGPAVLRYARSRLDDPRVPRALHRVVFATRYACIRGPGEVSRQAHGLLHKHFPESEWAQKTPHWYE